MSRKELEEFLNKQKRRRLQLLVKVRKSSENTYDFRGEKQRGTGRYGGTVLCEISVKIMIFHTVQKSRVSSYEIHFIQMQLGKISEKVCRKLTVNGKRIWINTRNVVEVEQEAGV